MIPGFGPFGTIPFGGLPFGLDESVPDPLAALLLDGLSRRSYLLAAAPWDPVALSVVRVWASTDGYASGPTDTLPDGTPLPNQLFRVPLARALSLENRVMSGGALSGEAIPQVGVLTIPNPDGRFTRLVDLQWGDADLTAYLGRPEWALQTFGAIFRGRAAALHDADTMGFSLAVRDPSYRLRTPLKVATYRGMGAALRGDGASVSASGALACPAGSMTVECWFRPKTLASTQKNLVGWRSGSAAGSRQLTMAGSGANRPMVTVRNDAATAFTVTASAAVSAGAMHHFAAVLDVSAGALRLLVDGAPAGSVALTGTFATVLSTLVLLKLPDAASNFADGDIDEVRIWDLARTDAQIIADKDRRVPSDSAGLHAYYTVDEGAGATLFDLTTGAHSLAIAGTPVWTGTLEGGPDVAGQSPPHWWGIKRQVEPVPVDAQNYVYEVSRSPCEDVLDVAVRGSTAGIALDAGAGDLTDIYDWSPVAGTYALSKSGARTLLRLESAPQGTLTVTVKGDKSGGGYVEDTFGIIKRLAMVEGGLAIDAVDNAQFARLSLAYPEPVGIGGRLENLEVWALMQELAVRRGGWPTFTRAGLLTADVLTAPGAAKFRLTSRDVEVGGVRRIATTAPVKRTRLSYRSYQTVQSVDTAATGLTESEKNDLAQPVRYTDTPVDARVLAANARAVELVQETLFDLKTDADAESLRRQALWGVENRTYSLPLTEGLYQYAIGDDVLVSIQMPDGTWLQGLRDVTLKVVGYIEDPERNTITLEAWGPMPEGVGLSDDDEEVLLDDDGEALLV